MSRSPFPVTSVALLTLPLSGALGDEPSGHKPGDVVQLFDGKSLEGWTTLDGKPVTRGWEVVDGTIHRTARGSDIISRETYGDFDLSFEWKVAKGANSGLKYKFQRFEKGGWLGCEYQVIDDGPSNGRSKHSAGSLYDVCAPNDQTRVRPAGEFNTSRVVVRGSRIEHWLNGAKIVEIDTGSEEWSARIAKSKFRNVAGFGRNPRGHIMLQEHGGEVWFRNITIRRLDGEAP